MTDNGISNEGTEFFSSYWEKKKCWDVLFARKKINFEGDLTFQGNEMTALFSFLINSIWYNADKETKGLIKIYYLA